MEERSQEIKRQHAVKRACTAAAQSAIAPRPEDSQENQARREAAPSLDTQSGKSTQSHCI
jgi:hypothetical protein